MLLAGLCRVGLVEDTAPVDVVVFPEQGSLGLAAFAMCMVQYVLEPTVFLAIPKWVKSPWITCIRGGELSQNSTNSLALSEE